MNPIDFAIIGGGWRAEFYLRIAAALPERFCVCGMLVRDAEKGAAIESRWSIHTYRTLDDVLSDCSPRFVVTSVSWTANLGYIIELVGRGLPVLSETPPAPDLPGMIDLWRQVQSLGGKVQVAEQFHLQPMHAARLAVVDRGLLGAVSQAQVSVGHGYHGISLIRKFLGIGYEEAAIQARAFDSPLVEGPGRYGGPDEETVKTSHQQFAFFDFGERLGLLDFTGDQYFNWVRRHRLLVRGERGEMNRHGVVYLRDFRTPIELPFVRHQAGADGDLEGMYLQGVQLGEEWLYRNPFSPASLTDEEIAIASCLEKMDHYIESGEEFYPLAEACQDHYLNLVAGKAINSGACQLTQRQPWAG